MSYGFFAKLIAEGYSSRGHVLDVENSVVRVCGGLVLCGVTDQTLLLGKGDV